LDITSPAAVGFIKSSERLMSYPLVSAIVLCYNQARFVVECLEAVKAQNYPNLELIINDDASVDDSVAVIDGWLAKNNISHHFLKSKTNQGICRSLNNSLKIARGKYVSGIAADDVWLPGKLHAEVELLEGLPNRVGVVYSDALQMDENGKLLPEKFIQAHRHFDAMPTGNLHKILWEGNFIPAMATMTRRECFDRVGLYDVDLFFEDWDIWLRIARFYEFAYSEQISAKYRLVRTSMVRSQWSRLVDAMCQVCIKHLKSGQLNSEIKQIAAAKLRALSTISFEQKSAHHKKNLLQAMKYSPTFGILARCLLAWCGVRAEGFERMRSVFCGKKSSSGVQPSLE
jgi:glycosyltransferase involved in cell wall biosynthesis